MANHRSFFCTSFAIKNQAKSIPAIYDKPYHCTLRCNPNKFKEKATETQKQIFDQKGGVGDLFFGKDRKGTAQKEFKKGFGGQALKTGDINRTGYTARKNQKQTISVERAPTRRLDTCITMYMPAEVKVSYQAKYTDTSI